MNPIDFIEPWYYSTVYYILFLLLSWMTVLYYIGSNNQKILLVEGNNPMQGAALLLTIVLIFFIGLRPVSGFFGDMKMYTHWYVNVLDHYSPISFSTEWFWDNFAFFCKSLGLNANEYF